LRKPGGQDQALDNRDLFGGEGKAGQDLGYDPGSGSFVLAILGHEADVVVSRGDLQQAGLILTDATGRRQSQRCRQHIVPGMGKIMIGQFRSQIPLEPTQGVLPGSLVIGFTRWKASGHRLREVDPT
jgi:hypothetical protein